MKKPILDELDDHIESAYGLKNFVSIQDDDRILYFTEWREPFVEVRMYSRDQMIITELFEKVPGSVAKIKKVG